MRIDHGVSFPHPILSAETQDYSNGRFELALDVQENANCSDATLRGNLMLEDILMLKRRWRVSAMALNLRAHRLGVISDWTYSTLAKQLSMAGFRRSEPGSDLIAESSSLLTQVMNDMRGQGAGFVEIARALDVRAQDVRDLMLGLVTFSLEGDAQTRSRSQANLRAI